MAEQVARCILYWLQGVDEEVVMEAVASDMVGSTAVVAVVSGCQIILSNCGDSRAILCTRTQTIPFSVDHKTDTRDLNRYMLSEDSFSQNGHEESGKKGRRMPRMTMRMIHRQI